MITHTCAPSADAPTSPLGEALQALVRAKEAEKIANQRRLDAEDRVLLLIGDLPPEYAFRKTCDQFRVTVRTNMRRTVDAEVLAAIGPQIPEAIGRRVIRWKPEIDTRELRYLQDNEPEIYATLAQAITAKPAKPTITVEEI